MNFGFFFFFFSTMSSIGTLNQIEKVCICFSSSLGHLLFRYKVKFCLILDILSVTCGVCELQMYGFFSVIKV